MPQRTSNTNGLTLTFSPMMLCRWKQFKHPSDVLGLFFRSAKTQGWKDARRHFYANPQSPSQHCAIGYLLKPLTNDVLEVNKVTFLRFLQVPLTHQLNPRYGIVPFLAFALRMYFVLVKPVNILIPRERTDWLSLAAYTGMCTRARLHQRCDWLTRGTDASTMRSSETYCSKIPCGCAPYIRQKCTQRAFTNIWLLVRALSIFDIHL